jgi:hypothetical protein
MGDFAIASRSNDAAEKLIATINKHNTIDNQGIVIHGDDGMLSWFNGVDIHHTRDYVKLSCATYIKRVSQTHG